MSHPSLRQFEYLVTLADCSHFGRAADMLHISQPTLSQQLRALETSLGALLVDRNANPVALTPLGRQVVVKAREMLLGLRDITEITARAKTGAVGILRFGITPTLAPYLMPPVIAQLHREMPDLHFHIREGFPDEQARLLANGGLDMLLAPLPTGGMGLHVEPLFRESLHFVAPPDHPLALKVGLSRDDMAGAAVLSLDPRHHFHRQTLEICEALGANVLRDYEGTCLDSLHQMVCSGLGLALLPALYLRSEVGGGGVVCRLHPKGFTAHRTIAALWRAGSANTADFQLIARHIATFAQSLLAKPSAGRSVHL